MTPAQPQKDRFKAKAQEMRALVVTGIEWVADPELELDALAEMLQAVYDLAVQETHQQDAQTPRACDCSISDPVMQADGKFYCYQCSFQTGARPNCLEPEDMVRKSLAASLQAGVPKEEK